MCGIGKDSDVRQEVAKRQSVTPERDKLSEGSRTLYALNLRPQPVSQALGGGRLRLKPLPARKRLGIWIEHGVIAQFRRKKRVGGSVGRGGLDCDGDLRRNSGPKQVVEEGV